ncbi:MAG: LUD domain-containing protein [Anaerolineales bacterium]|nr:LUD domain-containing protein [Anaerolineales bacterium]
MTATEFRERIRTSLTNESLQLALDANAERRVNGRINAMKSLPDWRERRQRAHSVRADIIEHLDEYLEQFIHNATQNGIVVHRAKDAQEAIETISRITDHELRNAKSIKRNFLVAKSKSMISEELDLNHVLESKGMKVVETDLGEYIVQLRNEKPAHIITPAIHLRRNDVGKLFHEKLGIPYTEDIPTLTNTARKVLRDVFLTADVGISGVNFGIAETGGICLVTNEGNGRMVTSLPPIHIALMGMERLVRNLDDLALMLSLLPRSATGQKLSVYTQLIHQPLPNQQRHIILLDNGRSRLRNSPLKESLYCIRCGSCLNACPVFRELGGHAYKSPYSGPIGSVISAGLFGSEFVPLAQASSLCGACKDACPVDIDLPKLLTRVRAGQSPIDRKQSSVNNGGGLSLTSKLFLQIYSRIATYPRLFAFSQKFASLGTFLLSPFSDYIHLPAITGWGYSKDLPRFAGKTFRERFMESDSLLSENPNPDKAQPYSKHEATQERAPANHKAEQFVESLIKVDGKVVHTTKNEVADKVIEFLKTRNIKHIHLEPNVLDEDKLHQAGITISHERDAKVSVGVTPHVSFKYSETCGVTKAICGLADTGSVLEADDEGDKLFASLLPEVHLAILHESDIYPSLENAIHLVRGTKSAAFITGPSRTGDIEMSHTIGVHGPGEIVVFLVA